jgi:hypothetical protein
MGFESTLTAESGWHLTYGMPLEAIGFALLWAPPRRIEIRGLASTSGGPPGSQPPQIPTWSWAGWCGPVDWELVPFNEAIFTNEVEWEFDSIIMKAHNTLLEQIVLRVERNGLLSNIHWHPPSLPNRNSITYNILSIFTSTTPASAFALRHVKRRRGMYDADQRQLRASEILLFNTTPKYQNRLCGIFFGPQDLNTLDLTRCEIICLARLAPKKGLCELPRPDEFQGLDDDWERVGGAEYSEKCIVVALLVERKGDGEYVERRAIGKVHVGSLAGAGRERRFVSLI